MRMRKFVGLLVVVGVVMGTAVAGWAAQSSVSVNASFVVPSWISLSIVGSGDVSFPNVTGPGTYAGSNGTKLRVLSTASWSLSNTILWAASTVPSGASQLVLDAALGRSFDRTSGAWGVSDINVSYALTLSAEDLANVPQGSYNLVIQYTATTN
jgi:hypothetical protein